MSQVIKTFLGLYLIVFMLVVSTGILTAYMEVLNAQDLQARIIDELENSNYAASVAKALYRDAGRSGCGLTLTLYYEDGGTAVITKSSLVPASIGDVALARVELTFPFQVAVLGIRQEHTLTGYAR